MKLYSISHAKGHVLDRILYLLEEGSVRHIAAQDADFAAFVGDLYQTVAGQRSATRT